MAEEISKKPDISDVIPTDNFVNRIKDAVQDYKVASGKELVPDDINIVDFFHVGEYWEYYDELKKKALFFAFQPTKEQKERWMKKGFAKLPHLMLYLKKIHGELDKFDIVFFKRKDSEPFYIVHTNTLTVYFINFDIYQSYSDEINPAIRNLKVTKYSRKIMGEFAKKVPIAFFKKEEPNNLLNELQNSYYKIIEGLIAEFENLDDISKQKLKDALIHSKLGTETIKQFVKLKPKSPEKQLKLFLEVLDKLGDEEVEELLNSMLKSNASHYFIKNIEKLPKKELQKILGKLPEMTKMYDRYEKLKTSLRGFEKLIQKHIDSEVKDEKDIHKYISKHYWLLGIQYFGKDLNSDIDSNGNLTGKTRIGSRKRADFVINRLDGTDICVIIELEEANDPIFNKDDTFSKKVYDGIIQAIDYCVEQETAGYYSKGIAVIGSLPAGKLLNTQKERLRNLADHFPNIEILTYDDIISRAKITLQFLEKYEKQGLEIN